MDWAKSRVRAEIKSNPESMPQPTMPAVMPIFAKQKPTEEEYRDGLFVISWTREQVCHTLPALGQYRRLQ
jgi:hypothetical protein